MFGFVILLNHCITAEPISMKSWYYTTKVGTGSAIKFMKVVVAIKKGLKVLT